MQALYAQLLVGLINGSFYALLTLASRDLRMLNIITSPTAALHDGRVLRLFPAQCGRHRLLAALILHRSPSAFRHDPGTHMLKC